MLILLLLWAVAQGAWGQDTWRLDSLLRTWDVQRLVQVQRLSLAAEQPPDTSDIRKRTPAKRTVLPEYMDAAVLQAVHTYGGARRNAFRIVLGRQEQMRPLLERILKEEDLPLELADLPMALSALNAQCKSASGEAGPWMLTWPVAIRYGLRVDAQVDQRHDPELATRAAASYLKDLRKRYGNWQMAVLAYMAGPAHVERARVRAGADADVRTLAMHLEPGHRDLLPTLVAMRWLVEELPAERIKPIKPLGHAAPDTLYAAHAVAWSSLQQAARLPMAQLRALNPTLIGTQIPLGQRILLPAEAHVAATAIARALSEPPVAAAPTVLEPLPEESVESGPPGTTTVYYRIKSGDVLGTIAQRHGVRVAQLKSWNNLLSDHIDVGEELVIHVAESRTNATPAPKPGVKPATAPKVDNAGGELWYTIRSGDTLDAIAKRYKGVTANDLMRVNGITPRIRPGQRIRIPQ